MGTISTDANTTFRDYVVDAVPSSGIFDPPKADIRSLFGEVDSELGVLTAAAISAGAVVHDTLAHLQADSAHAVGTLGFVYADTTTANNGVYAMAATSPPSWAFSGVTLASIVNVSMLGSDVLQYITGQALTYGPNPPVNGNTTLTGARSYISGIPLAVSGFVSQVEFYAAISGPVLFFICDVSGTTATLRYSTASLTMSPGLNVITNWNPPVSAGQYLGVYSPFNIVRDNNPDAAAEGGWNCAGLVSTSGTTVAAFSSTALLEMNASISRSVAAPTTGVGLLTSADATGQVDATSYFSAARASYTHPQVPKGTFAITAWPNGDDDGFWGSNCTINLNSVQQFISRAPRSGSWWRRIRSRLASCIYTGAPLIFMGDSQTNGHDATTAATSYPTLLSRWLNGNGVTTSPGEPIQVNFDDTDNNTGSSVNDFTFGGTSTVGTTGPVGKSRILQPGATISFTGNYASLLVFYNQPNSSGQLTFKFNGTSYATPAIGSGTSSDVMLTQATGQTVSGTHQILNSGAVNIEITGIGRLGALAGTAPRLYTLRMAHGSYKLSTYTQAMVDSALRFSQALASSVSGALSNTAQPLVLPFLGINDMVIDGASYDTLYSRTGTVVGYWTGSSVQNVPVRRIMPVLPYIWGSYHSVTSFEELAAGLRDGYEAAGVTSFCDLGAENFIAVSKAISDGHPNDAGMQAIGQFITEAIANWRG